jgi:hypothetical protein
VPIRSRGEPLRAPHEFRESALRGSRVQGGGAVTEQHGAAGVAEGREAPAESDRLLAGLVLTLIVLVQAAWFAGLADLVYLGARLL